METIPNLGETPSAAAERDAVHIAIIPMIAYETLQPGDHVGFVTKGDEMGKTGAAIGVVDPFRKDVVHAGESFWLCLYPGSITSLRHSWTHPVIAVRSLFVGNKESVEWITDLAKSELGISYEEVMEAARDYQATGDYYTLPFDTPSIDMPTFWYHYEKITGTRVRDNNDEFFSCAC